MKQIKSFGLMLMASLLMNVSFGQKMMMDDKTV